MFLGVLVCSGGVLWRSGLFYGMSRGLACFGVFLRDLVCFGAVVGVLGELIGWLFCLLDLCRLSSFVVDT